VYRAFTVLAVILIVLQAPRVRERRGLRCKTWVERIYWFGVPPALSEPG